MCFLAEVSFVVAAGLLPAGAFAVHKALETDRAYIPFAALPLLFGLQQFSEGLVWASGTWTDRRWVESFSLAYMFFSWLAWPVWVPVSTYFLEPCRRRYIYLFFAVGGGMLGAIAGSTLGPVGAWIGAAIGAKLGHDSNPDHG